MIDGQARVQASPPSLVDETGHIAWHTRTTLWGTTTWNRDATAHTPLRFPGQYADPETGLHYNHHRHYDPDTARYTTPDPLGLTPAPNPLTYPHNPHTHTDPLGLAPCRGTLYRSDTRDHEEIFRIGFEPRGENMDLPEHASGWSTDSGYVATTKYEDIAIGRRGNVYHVDGVDGIDVNESWPQNPFSAEEEIAIPGTIHPSRIIGVRLRDGTWIDNPNYKPLDE